MFLEWETSEGLRNMTFELIVGGEKEEEQGAEEKISEEKEENKTTVIDVGRKLLSIDESRHPMGAGEHVGTSVYPWEEEKKWSGGKKEWSGRKLLDVYGDSLKHVNSIYNRLYGSEGRKVPAHMPHFIQRPVLQRLMEAFPEQWTTTSSHQFRASNDMQFSFAYFYFLINERLEEPWLPHLIDTDNDGALSRNEFRTAWSIAYGTPIKDEESMNDSFSLLSLNDTQAVSLHRLSDSPLYDQLRSAWSRTPRNPTELHDASSVAFVMVKNNDTDLQGKLDGIRRDRHKFICLNDNLHHDDPNTVIVKKMLRDFYDSILPNESDFEKKTKSNRFKMQAFLFWLIPAMCCMALCGYVSVIARRRKRD